jgi:hypothetical protein
MAEHFSETTQPHCLRQQFHFIKPAHQISTHKTTLVKIPFVRVPMALTGIRNYSKRSVQHLEKCHLARLSKTIVVELAIHSSFAKRHNEPESKTGLPLSQLSMILLPYVLLSIL